MSNHFTRRDFIAKMTMCASLVRNYPTYYTQE
jgi:hypothetical protein